MDSNLFQNSDVVQDNPLGNTQPSTDGNSTTTSPKPSLNFKDPKILALAILGAILFILVILAIIVSLFRQAPAKKTVKLPDNITVSSPTPVKTESVVPPQFQQQFNAIEKNLRLDEDYPVPQVDLQIGL